MSNDSCVFCRIVANQATANILYRDQQVTAFRDSNPVGPTHLLIVPNKHIDSLNDLQDEDDSLMGYMLMVARRLAAKEGISESGYRLVLNTRPNGGQTVYHLHLHLIGGRPMHWPPG
ncbi:MAG TPA: histidine triad nucleotide-binding protein [Anaerolineales bacterium]|nr:histidine triad nucleotide-binding protein [Anaerolineales bacterium]